MDKNFQERDLSPLFLYMSIMFGINIIAEVSDANTPNVSLIIIKSLCDIKDIRVFKSLHIHAEAQ